MRMHCRYDLVPRGESTLHFDLTLVTLVYLTNPYVAVLISNDERTPFDTLILSLDIVLHHQRCLANVGYIRTRGMLQSWIAVHQETSMMVIVGITCIWRYIIQALHQQIPHAGIVTVTGTLSLDNNPRHFNIFLRVIWVVAARDECHFRFT
ncbi:hypothetical protein DPH57_09190 [Massilia sp. YMA4]|nr:hypothetical protein DPH57_09190 [Massilia sp. YMA4]